MNVCHGIECEGANKTSAPHNKLCHSIKILSID